MQCSAVGGPREAINAHYGGVVQRQHRSASVSLSPRPPNPILGVEARPGIVTLDCQSNTSDFFRVVLIVRSGFLLWFVDIAPSYDWTTLTNQTERLDLTSDTTLKKSEV